MILHEIREYRDVITIVCSNRKGYLSFIKRKGIEISMPLNFNTKKSY